jgi:LDH2 family malate/lactate/ureidoglycolate dehydrogenase
VTVEELVELVQSALIGQGFPRPDALYLADEFIAAEIAGIGTHGVSKLVSMNLGSIKASPTIQSMGPLITVDGNGGSGLLLFRRLAELSVQTAQEHGISVILARNFSRYSSLYPYTEHVSRNGLISILMNSAGPPAVALFGSIDPITGTNPVCFSFPTTEGVQTFDFATSSVVWGAIRLAALGDDELPAESFLDVAGEFTTDPASANAVTAFGMAKGSALNLAVELICGPGTGAAAGRKVDSEFDCGALFFSFDPARMGGRNFEKAASALLSEVRNSRPTSGNTRVRAPGDTQHGTNLIQETAPSTTLDIPGLTLDLLQQMASGEPQSDLVSNPMFN